MRREVTRLCRESPLLMTRRGLGSQASEGQEAAGLREAGQRRADGRARSARPEAEAQPRHEEPSASHEERILAGIVGAHAAPLSGVPGNPGAETPAQFGQRMAGLLTR